MPQDPPASSGGGAIYQDGDQVNIQLNELESTTVPSGKQWVVRIIGSNPAAGLGKLSINGDIDNQYSPGDEIVIGGGTDLSESSGNRDARLYIWGWAV